MHFGYLGDPLYITFIFSWTVLIIKTFHRTIFFNEVLFTSYCCIRYFHKRKKYYFISSLGFSFVIFLCKKCLLGQTKWRGALLTIFQPPGYSKLPRLLYFTQISKPLFIRTSPFIRDLTVSSIVKVLSAFGMAESWYFSPNNTVFNHFFQQRPWFRARAVATFV